VKPYPSAISTAFHTLNTYASRSAVKIRVALLATYNREKGADG